MEKRKRILKNGAGFSAILALLAIISVALNARQDPAGEKNKAPPPQVSEAVVKVLKSLEQSFAGVKTMQTRFVQEKKLAVFKQTIILKGTIVLENPGRFAWHVESPVKYSLVIAGDVIRQWDEDTNKVQKISLSSNPIFKIVSEQMQNWFRGKYASLTGEYEISVVKEKPECVLLFVPRDKSMIKKSIKHVKVTFRKDKRYVKEILIADTTGDTTKMIFSDTLLNRPVKPEVWKVGPRD